MKVTNASKTAFKAASGLFLGATLAFLPASIASGETNSATAQPQTLMTEPTPATLSTEESAAGLQGVSVEGQTYAIKTSYATVCSSDGKHQIVLPITLGYNATEAEKAGIDAQKRSTLTQAFEAQVGRTMAQMAQSPAALNLIANGAGHQYVAARIKDFGDGIVMATGMPFSLGFEGPMIMAEGCGGINSTESYGAALGKFVSAMRSRIQEANRPKSYTI